MNPDMNVQAFHANIITDAMFDLNWFRSFHLVLNALDNLGIENANFNAFLKL